MNYAEELLNKINMLLSGKWDVSKFESEYYNYYLDQVPSKLLTNNEIDFFGLVQEKLDWTSPNPTEEERKNGWADHNVYKNWLRNNMEAFLKDDNSWNEKDKNNFDWNSNTSAK